MKRELPAFCYLRQGKYIYFERKGQKPIRIHGIPGTPEFALTYAKLINGVMPQPTTRNFKALVKSYHASDRYRKLAPRTARDYDKVTEWVVDKLGHLAVAGMQRKDVIRAQTANADTVRFANYIVQVLRILMEHAIDIGWRDAGTNPARDVAMIKTDRDERQPWPQDLVKAYRDKAKGRALLVFELCLGTGQRIGDVLKMRWSDIEGEGIHVKQGKTKAVLWVPFTASLKATLDATPKVGLTICAWGKNGKPTSYRGAADLVMAVRKEIGAEAYDLHGLRYTAASELAALGCSDELIAAVTGHATARMVAKYAGKVRQIERAIDAQGRRK